ncbi:uncharacterized protein ColSpa_11360 [Colletotrichum spaethianum]|uniref:Uncharacterized protein n=1 Tax=Colletotrichum spaethianum TaxID=700344 RepID=A0AA37UKE8_9PEZI|nr:uncharacterized protein ColSpa_11360 [Colletotrichum spaethianum]GKT51179.1 hypothetical protein ColSpa_11360 [Colletotrichum spaethianum]
MCLSISIFAAWYSSSNLYDGINSRSIAASSIDLALYATHLICAIGTMVYTAKARKKVLGTPLQKPSSLMLTCAILWLLRNVWALLYSILVNFLISFYYDGMYDWGYIVDIFLYNWMAFVILVLLYVLATMEKYAMSQLQEQEQPPKDMDIEAL